ncbi:IS3 family transposase [Paenibacillus xylanexedens]|uniref:IS3 family transposase n=1 Tax=Paenibacillus xylanexedens TaxID=528191 RepID=UPI003B0215CF
MARSAYYKWLKWIPSAREREVCLLAKEVKRRYDMRDGIVGYRQMRNQLNRKLHQKYNKKRYYRIMRALGLKSTDVTELKYGNGCEAYLTAIIDLYDNAIISRALGHSNNNKLVIDTLQKAYAKHPGVSPMIESDRGFQYTSHECNHLQLKYGFTKSMSRVSRCLDNQLIERFWGTYKSESYYLTKYDTYEDLHSAVQRYMRYYNNYRYTERLGGMSPNEYRRAA